MHNQSGPSLRYTDRAAQYARYRWDYAPQAIDAIQLRTQLNPASHVADIGSGTGILTQHFVDRALRVYAVEPDEQMRVWAVRAFVDKPSFESVSGCAEATTLPDQCVDLIVVGQAIHWFEAARARQEFRRILKPDGYLAVAWNGGMDPLIGQALAKVCTPENGWDTTAAANRASAMPLSDYFNDSDLPQHSFAMTRDETWEEFFGALCSDSHATAETNPLFTKLHDAARRAFDAHSSGGILTLRYSTEL
ncbi:MAG TPA: class I SAM-dependent methyltransferase, partial [Anaerolineae bacterium]